MFFMSYFGALLQVKVLGYVVQAWSTILPLSHVAFRGPPPSQSHSLCSSGMFNILLVSHVVFRGPPPSQSLGLCSSGMVNNSVMFFMSYFGAHLQVKVLVCVVQACSTILLVSHVVFWGPPPSQSLSLCSSGMFNNSASFSCRISGPTSKSKS